MSFDAQLAREIISRMDRQNDLLAQVLALLAEDRARLTDQFGRVRSILDIVACAGIPASPQNTRELTVTPAPRMLASNESVPLARVDITNDDPAQPLWVSGPNVLVNTGRVILAQTTVPYILPRGTEVWGVCAIAFISVRVSELYNIMGMLETTHLA